MVKYCDLSSPISKNFPTMQLNSVCNTGIIMDILIHHASVFLKRGALRSQRVKTELILLFYLCFGKVMD